VGGSFVELERLAEIDGVSVEALLAVDDDRGRLVELWRASSAAAAEQWNLGVNGAGTLRGMHWHDDATDRIVVVSGRLLIALADIRRGSPTEHLAFLASWDADAACALTIPPGVLHGWWSPAQSTHVYSMSVEWRPSPPLGVRWDDSDLDLPWPAEISSGVILSDRDATLPALVDAQLPDYRVSSAPRTAARA
jgi:dTDP-4-dehydrorhamnose 3,5-epimerase